MSMGSPDKHLLQLNVFFPPDFILIENKERERKRIINKLVFSSPVCTLIITSDSQTFFYY